MVVDVIRKKLGNYGKYFQSAFQLLSRVGGGEANLFSWSCDWPFVVSVIYCDWSALHETWTVIPVIIMVNTSNLHFTYWVGWGGWGGGGGRQTYFREAVVVVSVIYCDWSALHETWTAKILYTVHVHWRWIEESKSLIWPNNLNQHLVAWFYVTFESSNVTSHFSALRPTYSWLPWGTYSCTEIIQTGGWDQIHHLFCDSWNTQNCCLWTRGETPAPLPALIIDSWYLCF